MNTRVMGWSATAPVDASTYVPFEEGFPQPYEPYEAGFSSAGPQRGELERVEIVGRRSDADRQVLYQGANGPVYAGEGGTPQQGLLRNTNYPVLGRLPASLQQPDGTPLMYTFDSVGTPFWRASNGTVMSIPIPYAQPELASLQASDAWGGFTDSVVNLPSNFVNGVSDLVTGNVTLNGFSKGIYDNSPVGMLGAAADGNYHAVGARFTGAAVGIAGGVAIDGAMPFVARGWNRANAAIDSFGPDVRMSPFEPELSLGSAARAGASSKIRWVDENAGMSEVARQYNDSASGARSNPATRSGQAPAILRTAEDGSLRLVKFDGVDGEVLVDRKMSVLTTEKAKAQAIRQSEALAENELTARWEVPTIQQAMRAQKLFSNLGINNISVKVVPWPNK